MVCNPCVKRKRKKSSKRSSSCRTRCGVCRERICCCPPARRRRSKRKSSSTKPLSFYNPVRYGFPQASFLQIGQPADGSMANMFAASKLQLEAAVLLGRSNRPGPAIPSMTGGNNTAGVETAAAHIPSLNSLLPREAVILPNTSPTAISDRSKLNVEQAGNLSRSEDPYRLSQLLEEDESDGEADPARLAELLKETAPTGDISRSEDPYRLSQLLAEDESDGDADPARLAELLADSDDDAMDVSTQHYLGEQAPESVWGTESVSSVGSQVADRRIPTMGENLPTSSTMLTTGIPTNTHLNTAREDAYASLYARVGGTPMNTPAYEPSISGTPDDKRPASPPHISATRSLDVY